MHVGRIPTASSIPSWNAHVCKVSRHANMQSVTAWREERKQAGRLWQAYSHGDAHANTGTHRQKKTEGPMYLGQTGANAGRKQTDFFLDQKDKQQTAKTRMTSLFASSLPYWTILRHSSTRRGDEKTNKTVDNKSLRKPSINFGFVFVDRERGRYMHRESNQSPRKNRKFHSCTESFLQNTPPSSLETERAVLRAPHALSLCSFMLLAPVKRNTEATRKSNALSPK
mmetsp:Transcript_35931/g.70712  ORF Transcript_35931/g.70712 Transcript_35931/m.70712 type:complete len:226 (+) Transcript_35931:728-1405(+)